MTRRLAALVLSTALAAPLATPVAAQDTQLSGTVAEVFGTQVVLATPEGRLLVTLPQGTAIPAPGTRLDLSGTRTADTFAARTVTAGPAADPAEAALPAPLRGLGLTDIRIRPDDDGEVYIYARGPSGWLRAEARDSRLQEVQADGAGLPQAVIDAMLPAAALSEPRLADIARLTEIDLDDDGEISVEGYGTDGMRIEIEFAAAGALRSFERERDDRRSLSEAAARERFAALGYTDVGFIERGGRHVTALAVNAFGDTVEVRLDDQGRVERERLWQD
ncbi:MAG: prevent-host-death protein [Rhodobacteraceae bacterium]|nr:prevent-host-death protein [Paracoccaceae bacterium]